MLPTETFCTVTVAAALTGIPARTIRRWLERGQLAGHLTEDRGRLVDVAAVRALAVETAHPAAIAWALRATNGHVAEGSATVPASVPTDGHPAGHMAGHSAEGSPAAGTEAVELARLCRDQQQQLIELAGRLGFYQARVQSLEAEVQQLLGPAPEPTVEPMANHPPAPVLSPVRASETARGRPWWQFWTWGQGAPA